MNSKEFQILREVFNEADPVGLFSDENKGEYDPEIKELLNSSPEYSDVSQLSEKLFYIFSKYFEGLKIDKPAVQNLAVKINQRLG